MVNKCSIPGCRSGYDSSSSAGKTFHRFPLKNEELLSLWLKRIPRADFTPTRNSCVCSSHFLEEDFITTSSDQRRSKRSPKRLERRRLRHDAVPTQYPNCPKYLSTDPSPNRSQTATSGDRTERENRRIEEQIAAFVSSDSVDSLDSLKEKMADPATTIPSGFIEVSRNDCLMFFIIETEETVPRIRCSVKFCQNLSVILSTNDSNLPKETYSHLSTNGIITHVSQAVNLLALAKAISLEEVGINSNIYIERAVSNLLIYIEKSDSEDRNKISFLVDQLRLTQMPKHHRTYSPSVLVAASNWNAVSPRCYKQILSTSLLTLPSRSTLHRISNVLSVQSSNSETLKYLRVKINNLSELDRIVILLIDEVYVQKALEFTGGKFFGSVEGDLAKTVLCFMIKSLHHHYQDVVALIPTAKLTASSLHEYFLVVNRLLLNAGFSVVALSVDNASVNRSFFSILCDGELTPCVPNPLSGDPLHLLFDGTHLFKNFYNNFQRRKNFSCPSFDDNEPDFHPQFSHVQELYEMERNMPLRMAHKLTETIINPQNIQRLSAKLADSLFHESTCNAMEFYINHKNKPWHDTLKFLRLIRHFWNTLNVRTPRVGIHKRDSWLCPITSVTDDRLAFLRKFSNFLIKWKCSSSAGLSKEINLAAQQTCNSVIELIHFLKEKGFQYILTGNLLSDPIEKRFGIYRQMSGSNYFVSVR